MRRLALTALAALLSALALAACGGGSGGDSSSADAAGDMQAFQECLAKSNVDMPTPPDEHPAGVERLPMARRPPDSGTSTDSGSDSTTDFAELRLGPTTGQPPSGDELRRSSATRTRRARSRRRAAERA